MQATSPFSDYAPALIRAVQVRNYRCLRHVDIRLDERFHVLVGPNGSGKSTLFDVIEFLFDLVNHDLDAAVAKRTRNFQDLVWERPQQAPGFEIAIELDLPMGTAFRYEIAVQECANGISLTSERGYFGRLSDAAFEVQSRTASILSNMSCNTLTPIFKRHHEHEGNEERTVRTTFYPELSGLKPVTLGHPDGPSIRLVPVLNEVPIWDRDRRKSSSRDTVAALPAAADAVRQLMLGSVQSLQLDSRLLRQASPPNGDDGFRLSSDGANLPWVVESLRRNHEKTFNEWLQHLRMALRDIADIRTVRREDDRHAYLMIRYSNDVEIPSWGISEGTLRLLVLTLLAYLPNAHPTVYLLEEPENGIHPMAIETAYQSLSSVYDSQVFIASHSPTLLRCVKPEQVLCFARDSEGGTVITLGNRHPLLVDWQESIDNDMLFADDIRG